MKNSFIGTELINGKILDKKSLNYKSGSILGFGGNHTTVFQICEF